ncbi:helicase-related protein [Blastococcus capsensis]|uniref:helicase-related protein n=2 Tax=Bacillati TaxID=1783272 RepID=UPI002540D59F|nr:helicase-related protein [Blastococcus capsensis]MDK3258349.1 helicase-related protein [Blastococcus capsensis]
MRDGGPVRMVLEDLRAGMHVDGVLPRFPVTVVAVDWHGTSALTLTYRDPDARLAEVLLGRDAEARLTTRAAGPRWSFDADGAEFRLAAEAQRMQLAALSDPMLAVATSDLEPLPHQIRAVYEEMLPRSPLRFLLADDPGAGKTIMAGLYAKELALRGDLQRCLIVAPGSLVEQWQEELAGKVGLQFEVLSRSMADGALGGSVFEHHPMLIARMDQLSRDDDLLAQLADSSWDLVVVDEAHRMSAHWYGTELNTTRRYRLGQLLGRVTRNLLLMTATPHAGKDEDFAAFLQLLDTDRFEGRGAQTAEASGLMRRMVKEQLLTFDGRPLFPERIAETVPYELSPGEQELYEQVTEYVRNEWDRAARLDAADGRTRTVGFALTVLQRRLASSPEAIWRSLQRRRARLVARRGETDRPAWRAVDVERAEDEELGAAELEELEEDVTDAATAARTRAELDVEIALLGELEELAARVRASGEDRKWAELRALLTDQVLTGPAGDRRKLIVFTEHRDTLAYLQRRIGELLGDPTAVVAIHGGVRREERREVRERFTHDPRCSVLVATDAAGEGLNLQAAHLMVNYDLPWNPNRIEQRFGRIHRIGQTEVCRLWNLVAEGTREGQVFVRLLDKIDQQRKAYDGRIFDVLGPAFSDVPLRDLLVEAIRYGEQPEVRARLDRVVDAQVADGLAELLAERALHDDVLDPTGLEELRLTMERARARRLQPHFVELFFRDAFARLGGRMSRREAGRDEVTFIPAALRERASAMHGRIPLAPRYARIAFDPAYLAGPQLGSPRADLLAPGHPLMDTVVAETLARHADVLRRGAVLVDPADDGVVPRLLVALGEEVVDGTGHPVSKRFGFVTLNAAGQAQLAGPAPYLDLQPLPPSGRAAADHVLGESWLCGGVEQLALGWAAEHSQPEHRAEVAARVLPLVERTRHQVQDRLLQQVNHWSAQAVRLADEVAAGRSVRMTPDRARRWADELEVRLDRRLAQLADEAHLAARPPRVLTAALVLPAGLLPAADFPTATAADTSITERRAVDAVLGAERALGRRPREMPHNNPGYDIESLSPDGHLVFLEVKGRIAGATDFFVTYTEVLRGKTAAPHYRLALVCVDPDDPARDEVRYVDDPFATTELGGFAATGIRGDWTAMWARGSPPH